MLAKALNNVNKLKLKLKKKKKKATEHIFTT